MQCLQADEDGKQGWCSRVTVLDVALHTALADAHREEKDPLAFMQGIACSHPACSCARYLHIIKPFA